MTAFAATFVSDKLVADAATGDELAIQVLTGTVSTVEFYESLTDEQLVVWAEDHRKSASSWIAEGDYNEAESHWYEGSIVAAVQAHREEEREQALAVAEFSNPRPIHFPFAGLVLA